MEKIHLNGEEVGPPQTEPSSRTGSEIARFAQLETELSHQTSARSSVQSSKIRSLAQFDRTEPGLEFY